MANRDELRARVFKARKARGLTQEDVASLTGLALRTYQNFEAGGSWPQQHNLEAILRVLDLDSDATVTASVEDEWSGDVRVFLMTIGAYLEQLDDSERMRFIREETRRIFAQTPRGVLEPGEAEAARRAVAEAAGTAGGPQNARPRKTGRKAV